jgi:hypothetical protein
LRSAGISKPAILASCCGAIATVEAVRWRSSSHIALRSCSFSAGEARCPPSFCSCATSLSKIDSSMIRLPSAEQPEP